MRRRVLITGASSGLGAEMARQLAATGHDLVLTARRVDRLEELRDDILAVRPGCRVVALELDVTDHDAVAAVFAAAVAQLGGIDRVIVNAGLGKGGRIGTGRFAANRDTLLTNTIAALAQCEAAMEHFYARGEGHLVVVSSISAIRGLPGAMNAYGASKAAVSHLAEGIRSDLLRQGAHDIAVTTLFPGYIASEMNDRKADRPTFMVDTETGVRAMLKAVEKEVAQAAVPAWPWVPLAHVMKHAPLRVVRRLV